ncbi:protein-disulfide reductase DsbD domain-containing protein, partial [Serratia quinivorans]
RRRPDTWHSGERRLVLGGERQKDWKTYGRSPGEGGIPPPIAWRGNPPPAAWYWPTPQRFDVAGISTQSYHDRVELPMVMKDVVPRHLAGTLTLSTCSNVCILTSYPFILDLDASSDAQFTHDFAQTMGQIPIADGLVES